MSGEIMGELMKFNDGLMHFHIKIDEEGNILSIGKCHKQIIGGKL